MSLTRGCSALFLESHLSRTLAGRAAIFGTCNFLGRRRNKHTKTNKRAGGNFLCFLKLLLIYTIHHVFSGSTDQDHSKSISILNETIGRPHAGVTEHHVASSWDKSPLTQLFLLCSM